MPESRQSTQERKDADGKDMSPCKFTDETWSGLARDSIASKNKRIPGKLC